MLVLCGEDNKAGGLPVFTAPLLKDQNIEKKDIRFHYCRIGPPGLPSSPGHIDV